MTAEQMFDQLKLVRGYHRNENMVIYEGESLKVIFDLGRETYYIQGTWYESTDREHTLFAAITKKLEEMGWME